jgi:UDP-N-acetylmuramyl tripeptide synthase
MQQAFVTVLGKGVRSLAQLRGGGSALPGLFVEKIDPSYVRRTLGQLPRGIVLVSGTNGKTTTTKMVVALLEGQGLRVFTNRTGSNFTRGVAAALLGEVDRKGKLDADIAVLELDEAHAVLFVKAIAPTYCLLLNVMRDQLDRFGEIDTTASLLHTIAQHTTSGVVINRDDPRLASTTFRDDIAATIYTYGVDESLRAHFPNDDELHDTTRKKQSKAHPLLDDVSLVAVEGQRATIRYAADEHTVDLKLRGIYNVQNAVGAVALTRVVMGSALDEPAMLTCLEEVTPAFGRGESIIINGNPCELLLVKNPAGFRLSLRSFDPTGYATMIAINDNYADGRDMSWLWDVDFGSLTTSGVDVVSGLRGYDMALRLQYDEVAFRHVDTNLIAGLSYFLSHHMDKPKRIYCTYTAMLAIRRELAKQTRVETIT